MGNGSDEGCIHATEFTVTGLKDGINELKRNIRG